MTLTAKAEATLGGRPLLLSAPVRWMLTEGVQPSVQTFDMAPADASSLFAKKGPVTLKIEPPEGNPVEVTNLWVLHIEPGPNPWISRITMADRRWFWTYARVLIRMNLRRNIGIKRILRNDAFAVEFDRAPDVAFARFSLDNKTRRFVALRTVQKTFEQLKDAEKEHHGVTFPLKLDERIGNKIRGMPIEGLEIDDQGDMAVKRALSVLPEAGVTVDYDGTVVVFSRAGGDDAAIIKALMPETRDRGHVDLVRNAKIRPKKVRVWFTRECELRFDFIEQATVRNATVASGDGPLGDLRRLENVLAIPDYDLLVGTDTLPQGTWITVDQAFQSWPNMPLLGVTRKLDHDLVQQALVPHMELFEALGLAGERPDGKGTLENWPGRIAAVQNHYRQTFRINRQWMDRILSLREYRLATIDPQSGQRGPVRAYGDYAILYSQRALWRSAKQNKKMDYAINRSAFPDGGDFDINAETSPAVVRLVDHDQGILHLDYRGTDPLSGDTRMIIPSQIALDSMPTFDARQRTRSITFDSVIKGNRPPRASASYRMSLILVAIPAAPNDKNQLHMIEVSPADIGDLIPESQRGGLSEAEGPVMDIRIGANVEVARVQWLDDRAADIEKCFGIGEGAPNLTNLVMNEGPATAANLERGASLNQIARAEAARFYGSLVDRYEGEMTGYMNGGVHLNGWTGEIIHEYNGEGETTTKVTFPPKIPQFPLASFLDSSTRAALFRLVKAEP